MRKMSKKSVAGINDMIHRGFKPEKCKTSLRLAMSRIKLMRHRRVQQMIQLKKEVAKLLENGQDQTARIRVEHVIREEKLMSAYDLIEVYCELIVARIQIIESQKNCPLDLKEAISSVIFASPRCDDIEELKDVQKHFVTKYGKEFVASVLELRPNCGVTSMLVDKLSTKTPDVETKVKVLTSIAKEHDIKWEPKSFEEPLQKVGEPFLKGPTSFESTSAFTTEPAKTDFVSQSIQKHEAVISTSINEGINSATISGADFMTKLQGPTSFESSSILARESISQKHLDVEKPSDDILTKTDEKAGSFSIKTNISSEQSWPEQNSPERQGPKQPARSYSRDDVNWSLDFKDAASAAKAAAESAERASIAARAAAVLAAHEGDPGRYLNGAHGLDHNLGDENLLKLQNLESEVNVQEEVHLSNIRAKNVYMTNSRVEGQRMDDLQIKPEKRSSDSGSHMNKTSRTISATHDLGSHVDTSIGNIQVKSTVRRQEEMRKNDSDGEEITKDSLLGRMSSSIKASYDGKGFVLDHASLNSSRQHSFEANSHPRFDDDGACSDDHIEIGDSTYVMEASFSQSKGSKFSDSSSYVDPWSRERTSGSMTEGRSSLKVHSVKESDADESARTRVDNPSPNYDTEPEDEDTKSFLVLDGSNHLGPTAFTGILSSGQTEKESKHSETLDHSYHESSQILVLENLTGGLRNKGFSPAPNLRGEESPYSRKSTRVPDDNISNDELFTRKFNIQDSHDEVDMRRPRKPSSNSDTSEEENLQLYESPRISEKKRIDTAVYRTGPRKSYQKSDAEDSEESIMTSTLVKSELSRKGRRASTSLVPEEDVHDSDLSIGGPSLSTQHRKARLKSSKQEVSYPERHMTEYKKSDPRRSYQKSDEEDSDESIMTSTLVKSEASRRGRRASTSLVPEEDAHDSDLTTRGPSLSTQHIKASSEPYKPQISYHEPRTTEYRESGPRDSRVSFSTRSDDIGKSESHQSFAESHQFLGGSGVAAQKHSRRTRPTPKDSKSIRQSIASDQRDSQDIFYTQNRSSESRRRFPESQDPATQDDRLDRKGSHKFLSPNLKTERAPVTRPAIKDLEQRGGASSEVKEITKVSGLMSSTSSSPKPASKFAQPKNLPLKTDSGSSESSGEDSNEVHEPKSPLLSSSETSRTLESKPSQKNPPRTESSGKKSPKPPDSTSGGGSKTGVASTPTQNDLATTSSSETSKNPDTPTQKNRILPPDSDAFTAYFKSLRANTRK